MRTCSSNCRKRAITCLFVYKERRRNAILNPLSSPGSPWLMKIVVVLMNLWYSGEAVFALGSQFEFNFCKWRVFCTCMLLVLLIPSCIFKRSSQQRQHRSFVNCIVFMTILEVLVVKFGTRMNSVLFSLAYIQCVSDILANINLDKTSFALIPLLRSLMCILCVAVPFGSCVLFNEAVEVGPLSSLLLFIGELVACLTSVAMSVASGVGDLYEKAFVF